MKIFYSIRKWTELREQMDTELAFVPTMGALHHGHLALVKEALQKTPNVVVSIFVNPKQFNQAEDLEKYPRTLESDLSALAKAGVYALLLPNVSEIYPENDSSETALAGKMAQGLEGSFRPGHFDGVVNVVDRLFRWVNPHWVFFGQKDLQQCLVVQELIELKHRHIRFLMIPTVREPNGLAMSSRNLRLSEKARENAGAIYQVLTHLLHQRISIDMAKEQLEKKEIEIEYLCELPQDYNKLRAWVFAGYLEGVRLIDNVIETTP